MDHFFFSNNFATFFYLLPHCLWCFLTPDLMTFPTAFPSVESDLAQAVTLPIAPGQTLQLIIFPYPLSDSQCL